MIVPKAEGAALALRVSTKPRNEAVACAGDPVCGGVAEKETNGLVDSVPHCSREAVAGAEVVLVAEREPSCVGNVLLVAVPHAVSVALCAAKEGVVCTENVDITEACAWAVALPVEQLRVLAVGVGVAVPAA